MTRRYGYLAPLAILAVALFAAVPASATVGALKVTSVSNTDVASGTEQAFEVFVQNAGAENAAAGEITLTMTLPAGVKGVSAAANSNNYECPGISGASVIVCTNNNVIPGYTEESILISTSVEGSGVKVVRYDAEALGGASAHTVDPFTVSPAIPPFGIDSFDTQASDAAGATQTHAGSHPYEFNTYFDFNVATNPNPAVGNVDPVEDAKDISVELPPGMVGDPTVATTCTIAQLANGGLTSQPLCPPASQVGIATLRVNLAEFEFGLYRMVSPPGVAARFAFSVLGTIVTLNANVRSGSDYGLNTGAVDSAQGLAFVGNTITFWGVPGDESHRLQRPCPGDSGRGPWGDTCPGNSEEPFFRLPTACTDTGLKSTITADSWQNPGEFVGASSVSHEAPGSPYLPSEWGPEVGITNCEDVPFEPSVSVQPTTKSADSPSGLEVDIGMPQNGSDDADAIAESDLKDAVVTMPKGMTVNPASATALGACTTAQVGLTTPIGQTPIHFTPAPANCPDSSKIGSVEIETPLLEKPLPGGLYLAKQGDNPFGSLLAVYVAVADPASGVVIKLPGHVSVAEDGQLQFIFDENPQLPFEHLRVDLFGGPHAALRTPAACGTYTSEAEVTPWSGTGTADLSSSFKLDSGPAGGPCPSRAFSPHLSAGTVNPLAGSFSPFTLRLTREDGTQEMGSLQANLPPGLLAKLKGVTYCPESSLAAISTQVGTGASQTETPSCPASSQVGTVVVGAGAGPNPFISQTGRAYLAGPYKGAPYSLAVIVPAVAGPLDLGSVLVRNRIELDSATTAIKVTSDPLPSILHGIPLDIRDLRVEVNRPEFTVNPTSCEPMAVGASVQSLSAATAALTDKFQVVGCDRLKFKPSLTLALVGSIRRRAHPRLIATLKGRPGDANIARAQVKLPGAAFLDQGHIGGVCTRVQFAAKQCPADSVYGQATATTPLLNYPISGPVYLRANPAHKLPDLVVALRGTAGEEIEVELAGKTDSVNQALRNTFEAVPDAPVSSFKLELFGGKRGLIQMSDGFCAHPKALVNLDGQNGKTYDTAPKVKGKCGAKAKKKRGDDGTRGN